MTTYVKVFLFFISSGLYANWFGPGVEESQDLYQRGLQIKRDIRSLESDLVLAKRKSTRSINNVNEVISKARALFPVPTFFSRSNCVEKITELISSRKGLLDQEKSLNEKYEELNKNYESLNKEIAEVRDFLLARHAYEEKDSFGVESYLYDSSKDMLVRVVEALPNNDVKVQKFYSFKNKKKYSNKETYISNKNSFASEFPVSTRFSPGDRVLFSDRIPAIAVVHSIYSKNGKNYILCLKENLKNGSLDEMHMYSEEFLEFIEAAK